MDWKEKLAALDIPAAQDEPAEACKTSAGESAPGSGESAKRACPPLNVVYERKGRGGKSATIIEGFPETFSDDEIATLASRLKSALGIGGSSRGGEILLQGDQRTARLRQTLLDLGFKTKGIKA